MSRLLRVFVHCLLFPLVRFFYRVRAVGSENIPPLEPFLLVPNHVSYVDAIVLCAVLKRPVRFLMLRRFYEMPLIAWVCRTFRAIPIEPDSTSGDVRESLHAVINALQAGDPVCLFPEGAMTRTGHIHGFKRGLEIVARKADVPVVPAYVDDLWGSIFSHEGGRCFWKWPKTFRRHVTVAFGPPLPPTTSAPHVRRSVMELASLAYRRRKAQQRPLHFNFWRTAQRMGRRFCMADATGLRLSWYKTLAGALMLARWMRRQCPNQDMVGMMMPASCGAALVNIAAVMCGKTPVNLNFTSSAKAIEEALTRCRLRTVFTSRRFLDRIGRQPAKEFVCLEDILESHTRRHRIRSLLLALFTPAWLAERVLMHPGRMDELATVMFTSGSTGKPKGVMLSHHNVVSNIEAMAQVLRFGPEDTIMGVLPPFHSFGFTTTLWLPLTRGVPAVYHPNPLDGKGVGTMIEKHKATIIMGTPSFYAVYTRGCAPEQFRSLRLALAGGQKLMPATARAFEKRFGLPLSEGYGCTEMAPVVSVNGDDITCGDVTQRCTRPGSVGRPLPGISVRIVDEHTMKPMPEDAPGIVLLTGPSVMMGYLDDPEATAKVIRDGWYVTADLGTVDDEGFLFVHDRVSRFSKIAGEMVPHAAVENALVEAAGDDHHFAVLSVPDPIRGEKLVALCDAPLPDVASLRDHMIAADVPNLWIPAARDFIPVNKVPLMPSGKLDLPEARRLATRNAPPPA